MRGIPPPSPGLVHHHDDRLLVPSPSHPVDPAVDQHPPEVSRFTLVEQFLTVNEGDFVADLNQLAQLVVCQSREQVDATQFLDTHQIVVR